MKQAVLGELEAAGGPGCPHPHLEHRVLPVSPSLHVGTVRAASLFTLVEWSTPGPGPLPTSQATAGRAVADAHGSAVWELLVFYKPRLGTLEHIPHFFKKEKIVFLLHFSC